MENTRITVILNAHRDIVKVLRNLAPVFRPEDRVLLYTSFGMDAVKSAFSEALGMDCGDFTGDIRYVRFNEYRSSDYRGGKAPKVIVMRMPNELFRSIPTALNHALDFVRKTDVARYVHFFYDDLVVCDANLYRPSDYEWFMDKYGEPFLADCKLNRRNYVFRRIIPRLVFMSSRLRDKLSFYNFEGRDHFVIDRTKVDIRFDERLRRFYMIEFIARAHKAGFVNNATWYPDPVFAETVRRDMSFEQRLVDEQVVAEVQADEKYMRDTLKFDIAPEPAVEPVLRRIVSKIDPEHADDFGIGKRTEEPKETTDAKDEKTGNAPSNPPPATQPLAESEKTAKTHSDSETAINSGKKRKGKPKTPGAKNRATGGAKRKAAKSEKA